ncbi:MAG: hypothetical protein FWG45_04015 [Oscillospiraceae bacterium]|nr:hypothetical protein [Oscillospiraceae bacterium]
MPKAGTNVTHTKTTDDCFTKGEIHGKLLVGQQQIQNGDIVDGDEVFTMMRNKYSYDV